MHEDVYIVYRGGIIGRAKTHGDAEHSIATEIRIADTRREHYEIKPVSHMPEGGL